MLFNASRQQYDERLQLVRRHAEDTQAWLGSMDDKYGWVGHLPDGAGGPRALFSVITVRLQQCFCHAGALILSFTVNPICNCVVCILSRIG